MSSTDFNEKKGHTPGATAYEKPASGYDVSGGNSSGDIEGEPSIRAHGPLKRQLKNRHVAMISLAGVIGVGIFVNTVSDPSLP